MGIYPPAPIPDPEPNPDPEPTPIPDTNTTIGNRVWNDLNKNGIQDATEPGVSNVTVTLLGDCSSKNIMGTTVTDSKGRYLFSNVKEGTYCIAFSNTPEGAIISPKNEGDENENDSDVNSVTSRTGNIVVEEGKNDLTWDMGIYFEPIKINDDEIIANTEGPVTTIPVLNNDNTGNANILLITSSTEGLLDDNGYVIDGATLSTSDTLVVPGEGTWRVVDGHLVTFTAEDGFEGVPTPIEYIVQDDNRQSNVAQIDITTECICDNYKERAIPTLSKISIGLMVILTSILGAFFFREELEEKI